MIGSESWPIFLWLSRMQMELKLVEDREDVKLNQLIDDARQGNALLHEREKRACEVVKKLGDLRTGRLGGCEDDSQQTLTEDEEEQD